MQADDWWTHREAKSAVDDEPGSGSGHVSGGGRWRDRHGRRHMPISDDYDDDDDYYYYYTWLYYYYDSDSSGSGESEFGG